MADIPNPRNRVWQENQILTRAAPTTDATLGANLNDAIGYRVIVSAELTRTLSGAGNLRCWLYSDTLARWVPCPDLDKAVSRAGGRDMTWGELEPLVGFGRVMYAADGVTVSAGTTVDITIELRYSVNKG